MGHFFSKTGRETRVVNSVQKPAWLFALGFVFIMSVFFGPIHSSYAIVRLEVGSGSGETLDATINPLYAVVYLGGIAASWNQKRIGYIMVLILSALSTWGFLGHTTGLTSPNLVEIGRASGVVFVFVVLVGEVASISAVILSTYALRKGPIKLTSNGGK